ncbi:probetacellulin isoform X2 [Kryptolebias marmoratus]|uniref:Betacellulin, epidermal growth factor family member n=1 Tax=Kryptolebias marmoratus TaxID=37003 RepID=A0A3Q3FY14_KRYMA|nr:probetacellulin isoform X2 [Kryptolebias marmoratus]
MVKVYRLYVGILAALALCKSCLAEWNATEVPSSPTQPDCHLHGDGDNCTETETDGWSGHFSKCPEELLHYCIHGECRYIKEQNTPSCRCQVNYIGERCQYVDLDWQRGEKRQIIIGSVIAGLVLLIALIVLICICSKYRRRCWERKRPSEKPKNGTEKLSMMDTSETHATSTKDSIELTHTNSV